MRLHGRLSAAPSEAGNCKPNLRAHVWRDRLLQVEGTTPPATEDETEDTFSTTTVYPEGGKRTSLDRQHRQVAAQASARTSLDLQHRQAAAQANVLSVYLY